jgi:peptidoglycan-N-acetylglucosamine deacetylase
MRKVGTIFFAVAVAQGVGALVAPARAEPCPGNPDALGTSRVLIIHPGEYTVLGTMQYHETLPLADKEVVLTFDDGPLPPASNQVLDTLAAQCVKATFFLVGEMAHYFPATVRRIYDEGHTIGSHSQDHPLRFDRLSAEKLAWEIDDGIASATAALGDPDKLAPFFRIPGLGRTHEVESELAARSLITFSSDVVADDWFHRIKPNEIISRAMSRLEKHGSGILLLHDIHKATAAALPGLLKELKEHGFHIVHVVFDRGAQIASAGEPKSEPKAAPPVNPKAPHKRWMVAISMGGRLVMDDSADTPDWPEVDANLAPDLLALPAPDADIFDTGYPIEGADKLAAGAPWPHEPRAATPASELPAPSLQDIGVPVERRQVVGEALGLRPSLGITGAN